MTPPPHAYFAAGDTSVGSTPGKQVVDFIGKVENFEDDFEALCARLDVPKPEAVNVNVYNDKIPDSLEGRPRYVDRMNRRSIDKVNELFARDFELFGYDCQ
jgi:hypothetical protein